MFNRVLGQGQFEIFLGHIGRRLRIIDQHVVPGLVTCRLGPVAAIPLLVGAATRVKGDDDSAIVVFFMVNYGADGPFDLHRVESFLSKEGSFSPFAQLIIFKYLKYKTGELFVAVETGRRQLCG